MDDINKKSSARVKAWRKDKINSGWRAFYCMVPADLAEQLSTIKLQYKLKNLHLYEKL